FTLQSALARPEFNHLGIDRLPVVIRYATRRANQRGLHNVRFAVKDAETFLKQYVAPSTIAEIHLYHPQPYHDRGTARMRVLTPDSPALPHEALPPGALFFAQPETLDYWAYITPVLPPISLFQNHPAPCPAAPEGRPRREIMARQRGLTIFRGLGTRRDELDRGAALEVARSLPGPTFRSRGPWCDLDRSEAESR